MLSKIYILTFNHREPSDYPDQIEFRTQAEAEEALQMYSEDGDIYSSIILSEYDYRWNSERIIRAQTLTA
jgi:hypothetical protein